MNITLQEAGAKLLSAEKIIITAHINPDGDALGSSLGLYHVLKDMGKSVEVIIDDDLPDDFDFLPGYELIKKPEAEKYEADLLVLLDVSYDERIGRLREKYQGTVLNIDHHGTNKGDVDYLYLDADRAATAEIIYQLVQELKVKVSQDIAYCLYTGMTTDTGHFRYSNTSAFTMRAAAAMLEAGVKAEVVSEALEKRSYKEIIDRAKAMLTIEQFASGRVAGIFIDLPLYESLDTTEGYIDGVRVLAGVDVAILMKEKEPGVCRVSMRSKGVDVSVIAASFDGGGHIRAAGCTIKKPLAEAKKMLLDKVISVIGTEPQKEA